jgi:hypothetical protein
VAQTYSLLRFFAVVLATLALTTITFGQAPQSAQKGAQAPSKSQVAAPVTMTECEGVNNCATWTFLGAQGTGQWPSGEVANLSVERYDNDSVMIRRADSTGSSAGLTAVYTGTRHGDRVGGEFTSAWPGHWENKSGNWYATVQKPQAPPPVMRVCDPNGTCGTWTWNNGHYDGVWAQAGVTATLTVVSLTPESVIIKRTDAGARIGLAYTYSGKISAQGDSILDGVWVGEPGTREGGASGHFTATWGAALGDNPAARPSRPTVVVPVVPIICVPWFFGVVCG